ncbi:hypothetical protein [Streptomyces bathyalis]|uniref:hypothetical protein n=1 Tax=Streptomyces bathyalis TaxID=2710756 RepID=UPI001FECEE08|nr:hypothetical protein [Streptomyces bathyalis]
MTRNPSAADRVFAGCGAGAADERATAAARAATDAAHRRPLDPDGNAERGRGLEADPDVVRTSTSRGHENFGRDVHAHAAHGANTPAQHGR